METNRRMQRQPSHRNSEDIGDFIVVDTGISAAPRSHKESFAPHAVDTQSTRRPQPLITPIISHGSPLDRSPTIHSTLTPASVVPNLQRISQTSSRKVRDVEMVLQSNNQEIAAITNICHSIHTKMATRDSKAILIYGDTIQNVALCGTKNLSSQSRSLQVPIAQIPRMRLPSFHHFVLGIPPTPFASIITVRLQEAHCFSVPYSALCFGSNINVGQFFAWFARRTGRGLPQGPSSLLVWLHDARYSPKVMRIIRSVDGFHQAKQAILGQYAEAKLLNPSMEEFAIFITETGWKPYPPEYFGFN
ncbi:hypothetical protein B0O99DRAFT_611818 [Bisporella sp. PMI_857]|nr:hypothetical protein B0O99DRAFT_611818 [Bisporella sp. PMI_857]